MAAQVERRRFTVDDYRRMGEAGILTEDDRVELIEGEIVQIGLIGSRHAAAVNRINGLLHREIGNTGVISIQNPIRIDLYGEPQPDVAVLRPREDYYALQHPLPADVLLLFEVAETSLMYDRQVKLPLYARAGIREVWLVDLEEEAIERNTEPAEKGFRRVARAGRGEKLESLAIPSHILEADAVLG